MVELLLAKDANIETADEVGCHGVRAWFLLSDCAVACGVFVGGLWRLVCRGGERLRVCGGVLVHEVDGRAAGECAQGW